MDLFAYVPRSTKEGETIEASSIEFFLGGKGANQAVALARLDVDVSFVGTIGEDEFGSQLERLISKEKINIKNLKKIKGQSGIALINVLNDGRNEVISFPGVNKNSLSNQVSEDDLKACSILISQMELKGPETYDLFSRAKQNGCTTILNLAPFRKPSKSLIQNTDILVVNETEFAGLSKKATSKINLEFVDENFSQLKLPKSLSLIVTLGDEGVVVFSGGERNYFEARSVKAIDTVGAGDCFVGALGYALLQSPDIFFATYFANCAASISVTKKGAADSMPQLNEVVNKL
tara:strand:- start:964 stop:1836 length:873 start_codon:yes stop_codon:yes gene_type:complete